VAPRQRAEASQQLLEGERFQKIVVRPGFQAANAVAHRVTSGQHQDWRANLALA